MTAAAPGKQKVRIIGGVPWTPNARRETWWAFVFLLPWIIGFLVFTAGPMVWSLILSFTDYDPLRPTVNFIGLENYVALTQDRRIPLSLFNTAWYTLFNVPLTILIGLGLALLLNRVTGPLAGFFRTAFYVPNLTPAVAIGTLFLLLLNANGLVNDALGVIGIDGPSWLNDGTWIKPGIIVMALWTTGNTVIIYFAALKNVPGDLYEAARMDGASGWQQFWNITVPMISGAIFFTLVINTIASLQMFSEVYTMFYGQQVGQSAAATESALFYVIWLFQQAFQFFNFGYASAMGWVLFVIIMVITLIQIRGSRRFVYYEGE
jgi:multiple sugar transport system permease protein